MIALEILTDTICKHMLHYKQTTLISLIWMMFLCLIYLNDLVQVCFRFKILEGFKDKLSNFSKTLNFIAYIIFAAFVIISTKRGARMIVFLGSKIYTIIENLGSNHLGGFY